METTQLALRPYLETIEKHCRLLDRDSLIQLIFELARQVEPGTRNDFLQSFLSSLPGTGKETARITETSENNLQAEVEELRQEIQARIESIEDGTYWDDPDDDDWQDSYYNDEDPDLLNDYQKEELSEFFSKAGRHFIHGEKKAALKIYNALFSLINEVEEHDYLLDLGVNLREARARHARCVYELSSREERIDAMFAVMNAGMRSRDFPLLRDVMDAETGDLEDFDPFLTSWQTALTEHNFRIQRVADLLLEVAFLQGGVTAVADLAKTWQAQQPLGYLYWLQQLEREENWPLLRDAGCEALKSLPHGLDRRQAAGYMIKAGKMLDEDTIILTGYRERFRSEPSNATLLELVTEANRQQVREKELAEICAFLSAQKSEYGEVELLVKSLLMNGEIDRAFVLCKQEKAIGWSGGSAAALLYGSIIYLLSSGNTACTLSRNLLENYAGANTVFFDSYDDQPVDTGTSGFLEVMRGLDQILLASPDLNRYRQWTVDIGEQRINHIVSNKHRKAYERAAMILVSLTEAMTAEGNKNKADSLLHEYCRVRYNRHVAFRREVRQAVAKSQILRGITDGL
ncbi:MAG: hypothetical protein JRF04_03035 [Deltaproteobacteria bacterium]|nr:hypothetical protein [Deltaproteobacteria bacterium]